MSATTQYREFVDFPGLSHFWDKAKSYLHTQVTARKRNDAYVPDRSYQELVTFIEKDAPVYPTLRVVDGNSITQYPLYSFTDGIFTFRGIPEMSADPVYGMLGGVSTKEFTYGPSGFHETTQELSVQPVSLGTIEIGE